MGIVIAFLAGIIIGGGGGYWLATHKAQVKAQEQKIASQLEDAVKKGLDRVTGKDAG